MATPKYLLCPPPCGYTLSEEVSLNPQTYPKIVRHRYYCAKCGYERDDTRGVDG